MYKIQLRSFYLIWLKKIDFPPFVMNESEAKLAGYTFCLILLQEFGLYGKRSSGTNLRLQLWRKLYCNPIFGSTHKNEHKIVELRIIITIRTKNMKLYLHFKMFDRSSFESFFFFFFLFASTFVVNFVFQHGFFSSFVYFC